MTWSDVVAIAPLGIVSASAVAVLLAIAARRSHGLAAGLSALGLLAALASVFSTWPAAPQRLGSLLVLDHYGLFYTAVTFAGTLLAVVFAWIAQKTYEPRAEESYVLLLLAASGSAVLVLSSHFVSLFLGLELLSIPLYALIAYPRLRQRPVEGSLKYLVLGSASAAFLLLGMALVYAELGTMDLARLAAALGDPVQAPGLPLFLGVAFMLTGVGFKLGVVPFHLWAPDVYQGAPAFVGGFIATVSKASMVALVFRYFPGAGPGQNSPHLTAFAVIAVASMFAGNLLALLEHNVKRILAYSSISHLGYVLVAIRTPAAAAAESATYYLTAYVATLLLAFGVIAVLSERGVELERIEDYRGLFWRRPLEALALTTAMLSLAGIPLTAGFIGKFYVAAAGVEASLWVLVFVLVLTSVIGLFYYLRVVVALYHDDPQARAETALASRDAASLTGQAALVALLAIVLALGIYPTALMNTVHSFVASLSR
jgi:NADH-quinone oxidoreductase subunit N